MKLLEKYKLKKLITDNIFPKISIFFFLNLSERITESRLVAKSPKEPRDKARPNISNLTLKSSEIIGIKGAIIDPPNPNINLCIKRRKIILL